jgi:hydroxymethylbilane synthase
MPMTADAPHTMTALRLGTRGSPLALFQANAVARLLHAQAATACEIVVIKTAGDRLADAPLSEVGGKRLFVKEIEDALLSGAIDIAVHSSKDLPAVLPAGLVLGAVLPREDPRDAVVLPHGTGATSTSLADVLTKLGATPRVGTSSVRRSAQLANLIPGARFEPIRGNLDTRLRKLDAGGFDAIVLAAAGLMRLGYGGRISALLPVDACVPAPGQGIIAVETRELDAETRTRLRRIDDHRAAAALAAEREVVVRLGGGCQMPIGACATITGDHLILKTIVLSLDGRRLVRADTAGPDTEAYRLGTLAAEQLLAQGAAKILAEVDGARIAPGGTRS